MALGLNDKLSRILAFLVGLRDPRIFAVMTKRGFSKQELDEGWQLFTTAAGAKLDYTAALPGAASDEEAHQVLLELDQWENDWFPVVSAALERHYPATYAVVFANLRQTEGRPVIVSVGTLLDRTKDGKQLPDGAAAVAFLKKRGFTPAVRKRAEDLLATLKRLGETQIPEVDPATKQEQEAALDAAWAWYKEWSAIARTLFTRGDVLVRLGLRRLKKGAAVADDVQPTEPKKPETPSDK